MEENKKLDTAQLKEGAEKVAAEIKSGVEKVAESAKPAMEKVKASVEKAKTGVRKTAKDAQKKARETTEKAKTSVKRAADKVTGAELSPVVYVQYQGTEQKVEDLIAAAKAAFAAEHARTKITDLRLYIKPEERAAYYVVNEKFAGHVGF